MMMRILPSAFLSVVLAAAFVTGASATTITFDNDTAGPRAGAFSSVDAPGVTFSDSQGGNLSVQNFGGGQSNGQGLGTTSNSSSAIVIHFPGFPHGLTIGFGHDNPASTSVGDIALLQLFNGANQVGQVSTALNRNDVLDQTVSYSGAGFDNATFLYADSAGTAIDSAEVVDDIAITEEIPEPATLALFGIGLMGLGALRRRRNVKA
jgi:hypothetical protein